MGEHISAGRDSFACVSDIGSCNLPSNPTASSTGSQGNVSRSLRLGKGLLSVKNFTM